MGHTIYRKDYQMKLIQSVKNTKSGPSGSLETTAYSIGDASKIIEILRSKIYSKPIQTLVQEYLCNARDAVREIKGSKILVSLISDDANTPTFKVRDYGPGISPERMKLFTQYGSTTKDGSNNQTGGFGLGSKLAWAYTDTINIVTFIDGTRRHYIASIGANKNGTLDLMSEDKTIEANGTEISLELKSRQDYDYNDFTIAIARAVCFWNRSEEHTSELQSR